MVLKVEICNNWDGKNKVCDSARCEEWLDKCNSDCYYKPFKINDKKVTVIEGILLKEKVMI